MAIDIMKIYNDFEIEISDINDLKKGRVTVGITVYLATYMLPIIMPEFKKKCPNIEVLIVEKNSTDLDIALFSGEIDFALMHTVPFFESHSNPNIDIFPLYNDPLVLVTQKGHPLHQFALPSANSVYPTIDLTLFTDEPFIMLKKEQKIRQVTDLVLQKANINPIIALTTKSFETARRLACEGVGVTLVPQQYLEIFPDNYSPAYYCLDEKYSPYWTLCVAVQKKAYISKAAQLFVRIASEKFGLAMLDLSQK
jgi:DNA-binding transcriptional LysR family regulator